MIHFSRCVRVYYEWFSLFIFMFQNGIIFQVREKSFQSEINIFVDFKEEKAKLIQKFFFCSFSIDIQVS